MTPAARIEAAIELLDAIIEATRNSGPPADRLIRDYFKTRRYAGSKDRRAVRDLTYNALRLCGPVPESGRAAMLLAAQEDEAIAQGFDGSTHGPAPIKADEEAAIAGLAPRWLEDALAASDITGPRADALRERAPLDVRVNALKASRAELVLPEAGEKLAALQGLRFPTGTPVESWQAFSEGLIEVQDHGSQLVCEAVPAKPGETLIDLCAGAGGKSLSLASRFKNELAIIACDTDKRRLGNLAPRAERAGAQIKETVLLDPGRELEGLAAYKGAADHVLVDAPCSGTGTLRRNPETRWRLDPSALTKLTVLQDRLLDIAASLIIPQGTITYVTCSLLDEEGPERIAAFLKRHEGWRALPVSFGDAGTLGEARGEGLRLDPYRCGTDGFFVAILTPSC